MHKVLVFSIVRRAVHIHLFDTANCELVALQFNLGRRWTEFMRILHNFIGESGREEQYLLDGRQHPSGVLAGIINCGGDFKHFNADTLVS